MAALADAEASATASRKHTKKGSLAAHKKTLSSQLILSKILSLTPLGSCPSDEQCDENELSRIAQGLGEQVQDAGDPREREELCVAPFDIGQPMPELACDMPGQERTPGKSRG